MSELIQIALIEDNDRFRSNLIKYFSMVPAIEVVFGAGSVEEGLSLLPDHGQTSILVLDIGLPGMTGLEGISHFKALRPDLDIIMLTSYEEEEKIVKALCSGACSYISKKSTLEEITDGITTVHEGGSFMSPAIAREIVNFFINGQHKKKEISLLTDRQKEIMELMIDGKTYSLIAQELLVSVETIRSHIKKIYVALHAQNSAEAVAKYLKGQY